jgi:Ni,Fe-hydrogenase III component G
MSEQLLAAAALLVEWTVLTTEPAPTRLDIHLRAESLLPAVAALHINEWGYLAAITGLDLGVESGKFEVLYHFCCGADTLTLRIALDRASPEISSVCGVIPSASFFERELGEMFGITVMGTPTAAHLFLPDNWPEGVYPLRKDAAVQES